MDIAAAQALAERTLAAIDADALDDTYDDGIHRDANRERVASDLAGLRQHFETYDGCDWCRMHGYGAMLWPCPDATRYADGLRRTAALYGVTP
jgi:hypothetical protein